MKVWSSSGENWQNSKKFLEIKKWRNLWKQSSYWDFHNILQLVRIQEQEAGMTLMA